MKNNNSLMAALNARLAYLHFFVAWGTLNILNFVLKFIRLLPNRKSEATVCIEAGERGWESIEFKELFKSTQEYVGGDSVIKFVVRSDLSYLKQVAGLLSAENPTHYIYDPRTGSQFFLVGLIQSYAVAMLFVRYNIVPIVLLTDLSVRTWRCQAAVVSAIRGCVVCFMAPKVVQPIFPHSRLLGPSLMPFSLETCDYLDRLIARRPVGEVPRALFSGSMYEPRTTIINKIQTVLELRGILFDVKGRVLGTARVSDEEYWERLCFADIVFTTADQMIQDGTDWTHIPHLVYRYLEVLASGSMLLAQAVPSVARYFRPGEHFVEFKSPEEAADLIEFYLANPDKRAVVAARGKMRANQLISSHCFWISIESMLGADCVI